MKTELDLGRRDVAKLAAPLVSQLEARRHDRIAIAGDDTRIVVDIFGRLLVGREIILTPGGSEQTNSLFYRAPANSWKAFTHSVEGMPHSAPLRTMIRLLSGET